MTEKQISELIEAWDNIKVLAETIGGNKSDFDVLMKIALHGKNRGSWRAAYVVDLINDRYPELVSEYIEEIIIQTEKEKSNSKKRHFYKLISLHNIDEKYVAKLFNRCVKIVTAETESVAVRVHSMQILYNISETEYELKPEVRDILKYVLDNHPSAGIVSRGTKLIKKLNKQIVKL